MKNSASLRALSLTYMALIFALLYLPILVIIIFSFNSTDSVSLFAGISLKNYAEILKSDEALRALGNTLILATVSALISTVFGTVAAVGIYKSGKGWYKSALMSVTNIPMMNPEIVTGVSMMLFFVFCAGMIGFGGEKLSFWTLLIAHITFELPYVILSVLPKLGQIDPHLEEAAMDLGCTRLRAFYHAILPTIMPGVISGMLMAFTMSLDDFVISYFTTGTSFTTLPIYIYNQTKHSIKPDIYALSTIIFAVILLMLILSNILQSRGEKKSRRK